MATAGKLYTEERMTGSIASDTPFLQGSMAANAGAAFVDKTLTKSGTAADAKEVGDRLQKMNTAIDGKQPKGDYALKSEIPSIPDVPVKSVNNKTGDVQLSASDVGARPSTWTPSAEDVGADARGTADKKVSEHNTSDASHNDIRLLITGLTTRLNAVANSTDTDLDQLAEIVAYIKANKSLIDSVTTSKVNVADIIDNLTTSVSNKPLSAKMGVQLKALIDAIKIPTTLPASDVYSWAKQPQKPSYNKTEVGLGNVNNERQYSANNPPPYPVASVNGKTGAIQLGAADVGAASAAKVSELFEAIVYVTPQMFGAVGDGVADDTVAMQSAFDDVAENGKYLFIPQGKYKVTRPITVNFHRDSPTVRNFLRKIIGAGCGSYESMWDNSVIIGYNIPAYRGVIELIGDGNTWDTQTTIEDLAIMCDKASCDPMSFALMYGDARSFRLQRVKLEGHNGIYARCGSIVNENGQSITHGYGQIDVKFEQCDIFTYEDSTRGFAFLPEGVITGDYDTMDNISVDSCWIRGVWVITSVNVMFQSCQVCIRNVINKEITTNNVGLLSGHELDYATGFYVAQAMSAVFQNCYFEDYRRGIHITPTLGNVRNVSIMNCYINPGCNQFNTDGTRLCADYGVRISNGASGKVVRNVLVQNNVFRFIEGDTEFVIANVSNEFANHFVFRDNCTTNTQEVPKVVNTTKSGYDIQNGADSGASVRSITNSEDGKTFTIELTNDKSYSFNTSVSTPVKGTDYFTDEEIDEITGNAAALAKAGLQQIPTPTWVESVSQMADKSKNYVLLESGNIWAYMKRTKIIGGGNVPNFTNCMDNPNAYIKNGQRYSQSSAAFKAQASDCAVVIPLPSASSYTIRVRGATWDGCEYQTSFYFGQTNQNFTGSVDAGDPTMFSRKVEDNGDLTITTVKPIDGKTYSYYVFHVAAGVDASKLIVTVNEEITYTTVEPTVQVVEEWTDTGHHI